MDRVCLFHRVDLDGKCSAAIVQQHFGNNVELVGINYGDDYEKLVFSRPNLKDEIVIMVDFALQPWDLMVRLLKSCGHLIWIDHHTESVKEYDNWLDFPEKKIDGSRLIGQAGCELTWRYFHNDEEMPTAVHLIGRYDVWDWKDVKDALEFQMGMRMEETWPGRDGDLWSRLIMDDAYEVVDKLIEQGKTVLRYKKQQDAIHIKSAGFNLSWKGKVWLAINEMFNNSQLFDEVYDPELHHGMLTFGWRHDQWHISLYTTRDDVDCGAIATVVGKELGTGGGGHKKAAGFQAHELPFDLVKDKLPRKVEAEE